MGTTAVKVPEWTAAASANAITALIGEKTIKSDSRKDVTIANVHESRKLIVQELLSLYKAGEFTEAMAWQLVKWYDGESRLSIYGTREFENEGEETARQDSSHAGVRLLAMHTGGARGVKKALRKIQLSQDFYYVTKEHEVLLNNLADKIEEATDVIAKFQDIKEEEYEEFRKLQEDTRRGLRRTEVATLER